MGPNEHPLRRRYAFELALGLVLIGIALLVLFLEDGPSEGPAGVPPPTSGSVGR